MALRVTVAGVSSRGRVRKVNQDRFGHLDRSAAGGAPGHLAVIADGMGGAAGGEVASRIAVDVIAEGYARSGSLRPEAALSAAFERANRTIHERAAADPGLRGMGTTCTALVLESSRVTLAHVGDSRAYRIANGVTERLTEDHSLASRGQAFAHVLTRALGVEPEVEVDVVALAAPARPGDAFLLCSDGLWGQVSDPEMHATVAGAGDLKAAGQRLVDLANDRGGPDNITVLLVRIEEVARDSFSRRLNACLRRAGARLVRRGGRARTAGALAGLLVGGLLGGCAQKADPSPPATQAAGEPAPAAPETRRPAPADPNVRSVLGRAETAAAAGYVPGQGVLLRVEGASLAPAIARPGERLVLRARLLALAPTEDTALTVQETWSVLFAGFALRSLPPRQLTLPQGTSEVERVIELPPDAADGDYAVEVTVKAVSELDLREVTGSAPFVVASAGRGPGPSLAPPGPGASRLMRIRAESVDVRAGPGASFRPRARISRDATVELLEDRQTGRERWYRVRLANGDEGWIPAATAEADAR